MNEEILYQTYLKTVEQNKLLKTALKTYKNIVNEQQTILQDYQNYKGLLNDKQIKQLCLEQNMISPFVGEQVRQVNNEKIVSYGLTSFGYDVRLGKKCCVFKGTSCDIIDIKTDRNILLKYGAVTKNPKELFFEEIEIQKDGYLLIPPNSLILAETMESFIMPDDVFGVVTTKSTYARAGLIQTYTTIEPNWKGILTLELANATPSWLKVYIGEGIAQITFTRGEKPNTVYGDGRKYQNQTGVTLSRL